jgi:gamma-glutamyl-gamma-aminobutyraldehyde dehydrogenase
MIELSRIEELKERAIAPQSHIIDGKRVASVDGAELEVLSPRNGRPLTTISAGGEPDIGAAVAAARRTFDAGVWSRTAPAERKKILQRLAELLDANAYELAVLGVRDNGTEISMALKAEPGSAAATFRYYAEAVDKVYGEIAPTAPQVIGLVERGPVGVVGVIVPWNFPLMIGAWKIAPALAAGNSVVLKPAETASLSLLRLAELALEAGLPEGVLNVVTGLGTAAGEALALHPDVDILAFTGSGGVGRRLLEYSARSNLKHIYLELGGKSPNIVFPDAADMDKAVAAAVNGIFRNSGQVCISGSRLLLHRDIHDEFLQRLLSATEQLKVGDPLDPASNIGAVNSLQQLQKNLDYVEIAEGEGARLCSGGQRLLPLLSVIEFADESEAAAMANATDFGLAAGVWTADLATAHRMIRKIRAGVVHVNCYGGSDITVPLAGMKQSGNGADKSLHALDKYTALKTAWINLD